MYLVVRYSPSLPLLAPEPLLYLALDLMLYRFSPKVFINTVAMHIVKKRQPEKRNKATVREYRPSVNRRGVMCVKWVDE